MTSDAHKHDHWAESLTDEELETKIAQCVGQAFVAEHEAMKARFKVDRLRREQKRRTT